mgnify:FL=1
MKAISMKETGRLNGTITIQGSKNTVLPIMAATVLGSGIFVIENCPVIEDVYAMCELLQCLQIHTTLKGHTLTIDTTRAAYTPLPYEMTSRLRSSILLLGPMLARWQQAEIGMPGGCAIGLRPIDIHLEGLMKMNVDFQMRNQILYCNTYHLQGCEYHLRFPSVGATENLILAAAGAVGRTILRGAAKEPEIIELCQYLQQMGVLIEGVGTDVLTIKGTSQFVACDYNNVYDRIVAGTYLLMAAAIPCDIKMKGIDDVRYMANVIRVASQLGAQVVRMDSYLEVQSNGWINPGTFQTGSYPEFPTDLQPVLVAALLRGQGISYVEETVFEKRFSVVSELRKLGAEIEIQNQTLKISGGNCLQGHTVKATDLRQGAALVLAGLISKGYTTVTDISYIERGYEDIVEDLRQLGAKIQYI